MPILAIGNKYLRPAMRREAGFSLVELLAVLAILSLMVGAVMLSLPASRSAVDQQTEGLAMQLDRFIADGAVSADMRALGLTTDTVSMLRYEEGVGWINVAEQAWPEDARLQFERNEQRVQLSDTDVERLLFEPYGAVPDFTLIFRSAEGEYQLTANAAGRIVRTVSR